MATRGTFKNKPEGRKHKPDMVGKKSKEVFTGEINREHVNHPKWSIKPADGGIGFTSQGKMTLKQLEEKYPGAQIKPMKF